jgi:DNA-binding response OmpR family regulator
LKPDQRTELRLLVVDTEPTFRSGLAHCLQAAGYYVEQAAGGKAALARLTDTPFDGLIFDLDVPDLDGVACMQEAHAMQPGLMIIVVTSSPTLRSAISAIKSGVVDYLVKPLDVNSIVELVSCVFDRSNVQDNQLIRLVRDVLKTNNASADKGPVQGMTPRNESRNGSQITMVHPLRLDHSKRVVTLLEGPSRTIRLTRGETIVLASLMSSPDQPVSCQHLVRAAWQYDLDPDEAGELIRPYIFRLRRKLEDDPKDPQYILTMRGQGYMFASSRWTLLKSSTVHSI